MDNITELFETNVQNLSPVGKNGQRKGLCTFHEDTHPSFSVNLNPLSTEYGLWKCFAGCGSGTAADFAERLGRDPGLYRQSSGDPLHIQGNKSSDATQPSQISADQELSNEDKKMAMGCYKHLLDNFDALKEEGVIPSGWTLQAAEQTYTGYDSSAGAITFVHTNEKGQAVNLKWHKSRDGKSPRSIKRHGGNRLYPRHLIDKSDPEFSVYCEGEPDVLTCLSQGIPAVTGTCGAESIPEDLTPLRRYKSIIVIQDNDKSGEQGALKAPIQCRLDCPETDVFVYQWPPGTPEHFDLTDFFENGGTDESFTKDILEKSEIYEMPKVDPVDHSNNIDISKIVPQLDHTVLTPSLQHILSNTSQNTDSPDEFILAACVAIWAGVVGNKLRGPNDLLSNLWIVNFARSGIIRKSTALSIARRPTNLVQNDLDAAYKQEIEQYKKDRQDWENKQGSGKNSGPPPIEPKPAFILLPLDFSDAGFYMSLKNNVASGIIVASEFSDFHNKLHRKYTSQAEAFLVAYDNERMVRITRQHGLEVIEEPSFSILGATTFESFRAAFKATELENGFLQRVFPLAFSSPTKPRMLFLERRKIDPTFVQAWANKMKMWMRRKDAMNIIITDEIQGAFDTWENDFVTRVSNLGNGWIEPHIERLVPGCLKLAMIIDSMEIDDPISSPDMVISIDGLKCAQMFIENLFVPSLIFLRHEVIVFGQERLDEKAIEQALKRAGGTATRSSLARETRLSKTAMDQGLLSLEDKQLITIEVDTVTRKQGGGSPIKIVTWIGP